MISERIRTVRGRWRSIIATTVGLSLPAAAQPGDTTADAALGQPNLSSNQPNQPDGLPAADNLALSNAAHIALAPSGRVYVSDPDNNRVLSWPDAATFTTGQPADFVLGQPDFESSAPNNGGLSAGTFFLPQGVFVDAAGNVWVADAFNHRVLRFNDPFNDATPVDADLVVGQYDFVSRDENLGQGMAGNDTALPDSLLFPGRVIVYGGSNLYIADSGNSRVLHYMNVTGNTPVADRVFGQYGDFTTRAKNNDGNNNDSCCCNAENMFNPIGIARDAAGRLWVADWNNHRVLRFDDPLADSIADAVLGQPDLFSNDPDGVSLLTGLHLPIDLAFDARGRLIIADSANHRVLVHDRPTLDSVPDLVFGQHGDFFAQSPNHGLGEFATDADGLFGPTGVAAGPAGHVLILDTNNNRALRFNNVYGPRVAPPAGPRAPIDLLPKVP